MRAEQTVSEMVVEALARQAETLSERTGRPFEEAFAKVLETPVVANSPSWPTGRTVTRRPPSGRRA